MKPSYVYAIDALSAETGRPIQEIAEMFTRELSRLRVGARIEDYLVLLASRHVREDLRSSLAARGSGALVPSMRTAKDFDTTAALPGNATRGLPWSMDSPT